MTGNLADQLERPGGLTSRLLDDVERDFARQGKSALARWVHLEKEGYPPSTSQDTNLSDLLGHAATADLVRAVLAGRVRRGNVLVGEPPRLLEWPHFFVESVDELRRIRDNLAGWPTIVLELEPGPGAAIPRELSFPRGLFDDVLGSIAGSVAAALRGELE